MEAQEVGDTGPPVLLHEVHANGASAVSSEAKTAVAPNEERGIPRHDAKDTTFRRCNVHACNSFRIFQDALVADPGPFFMSAAVKNLNIEHDQIHKGHQAFINAPGSV